MNKKLVVATVLIFGAAGIMLAQGAVKAQDATDNSALTNSDNGAAMNADTGAAMNADNAAVPAAQ